MPDKEGDAFDAFPPEGLFQYGNQNTDLTIWLHERVRAQFAEFYSDIYDKLPAGTIAIITQLVMAAMAAAEDTEDPPDAQKA